MSVDEFYGWVSYYGIEPWGSIVDAYRHASVASASFNSGLMVASPKEYSSKHAKVKDFLVGIKPETTSAQKERNEGSMGLDRQKMFLGIFKAMASGGKAKT